MSISKKSVGIKVWGIKKSVREKRALKICEKSEEKCLKEKVCVKK